MIDKIIFSSIKPHYTYVEDPNIFEYRSDRKYRWLQKICFYILKKIEAYYIKKEVAKYERIEFSSDDFIKNLFFQKKELFSRFGRDGNKLIIGSEDFSKLMKTKEIFNLFTFNTKYNKNDTLMGLEVIVIPWVKGMVII